MVNITLGQFFPGNSPVHKLDPRMKIVLTLFMIVAVFLVKDYLGYAFCFAYVLGSVYISKCKLRVILKSLKSLLFIIAFTFVLNVFFATGGNEIFKWGFVTITDKGLNSAVFMALRLILLVIGTQLLTLTTSPISLTDGMESLFKPLSKIGFPAHELAMMMSIALRFIPTLLEEADKIMMAQKARGADFESGNLINRAKAMLPLLVPLFVSAFRRADELALAMEARCYRGGEHRTRMKVYKLTVIDLYAAVSMLILLLAVVVR